MKRKLSGMSSSQLQKCLHAKSASRFANFFRDDCLIDFLEKFQIYTPLHLLHFMEGDLAPGFRRKPPPSGMFKYLIDRGNRFESEVYTFIKSHSSRIYEFPNSVKEILKDSNYHLTRQLLNNSDYDILLHPVVRSTVSNTFGSPDMIARGKALQKLLPEASGLMFDDCWYIVDIKSSTLQLDATGTYLQNNLLYDGFRAQLAIYTKALKEMIDHSTDRAFVWGRGGSKYKLGLLDFSYRDGWVYERLEDAVEWFNKLDSYGSSWGLSPPTVPELYPNMGNAFDGLYAPVKKALASRIGEITQLWNCNVDHRRKALLGGVKSIDDPKLTPEVMGIMPTAAKYKLMSKLLDFRTISRLFRIPAENNVMNWRSPSKEVFVDIETAYDSTDESVVFLIGAYFEGKYRAFLASELDKEAEEKVWNDFVDWIEEFGPDRMVHWGLIENTLFKKLSERHSRPVSVPMMDLLEVFRDPDHPILVKDVFDFSIKTIANRLHSIGEISETYSGALSDGGAAMVMAMDAYRNNDRDALATITSYNKQDCRILYKILDFLRFRM